MSGIYNSFSTCERCNTQYSGSHCGCLQQQTDLSVQSLPAPSNPCGYEGYPDNWCKSSECFWDQEDVVVNGETLVRKGDPMTTIIRVLISKITV